MAHRYNSMVVSGKVREAVQMATSRDGGGLLHPDSTDAKSGKPVVDVLQDKHQEMWISDAGTDKVMAFEPYPAVPAPLPLDSSEAAAARVTKNLSGGTGPDSIDSLDLKNWLLYHKKASQALREELVAWVEWVANKLTPWAAYRATKNCRLVALDKRPGVRPVSIASVWDRAICKLALSATGLNTKAACGSKQLCAGLEAGIEDGSRRRTAGCTRSLGQRRTGRVCSRSPGRRSRRRRRTTRRRRRQSSSFLSTPPTASTA